jgi:hypothetical protein
MIYAKPKNSRNRNTGSGSCKYTPKPLYIFKPTVFKHFHAAGHSGQRIARFGPIQVFIPKVSLLLLLTVWQ